MKNFLLYPLFKKSTRVSYLLLLTSTPFSLNHKNSIINNNIIKFSKRLNKFKIFLKNYENNFFYGTMYNRFACLKTTEKRSIRTKIKFFIYVKHINNIDLICCIIYAICNTYYHFYFFFKILIFIYYRLQNF